MRKIYGSWRETTDHFQRFVKTKLVCPECLEEFNDGEYELMGSHIIRHEPLYNHTMLKKAKKCSKGCGRWIEGYEQHADNHEELCRGETPFF